jgi:hypothetical protein
MLHSCSARCLLLWLARVDLALATLVCVAGCGVGTTGARRVAPTNTPAAPLGAPHLVPALTGISLATRDQGWIIGRDGAYNGIGAFLLQLHNGGWQLEPFPAVVDAKLATPTSIAMVSADTGWIAATLAPNNSPVMLQKRAGGWVIDKVPRNAGIMTALSAPTAEEAWALSTSFDLASGTPTSAILRYRDGQWAAEATFPGMSLTALSMDSADDGWAAGSDGAGPVLLHYTQGAWARVEPAALGGLVAMTDVVMVSSSVGWATGFMNSTASCTECGGGDQQRIVLRFAASGWQQVPERDGGTDDLAYTDSADERLLPDSVAAGGDGSGWVARGLLVHFAPNGQQQVFRATCKTDFLGMALVPSSAGSAPEGWILGSHGQVFHLIGNALTRYDTGAPCDPFS